MNAYAIASLLCAASLGGSLVLFHLYSRTMRRLKQAEEALAAGKSGVPDLIAENIELGRHVDQLQKAEVELYALRREHARTNSNLQHLARIEAGLRFEITRLRERLTAAQPPAQNAA